MTQHPRLTAAFTMVEMAIVLVIVGLLIGGIMGGRSLIKQSELQSVIADFNKYSTATTQFRQQYGGWPGDLLDATSFWGDATACPDAAVTDGTPGTCNGNNDDQIASGDEPYRAWQHLVMAKYLEGSYTGVASGGGAVPGTNVPAARISNGGWSFSYKPITSANADFYDPGLSNYLALGATVSSDITRGALLSTNEAWQIDKKIDDGTPGQGRVLAYKPGPGSTINPNCASNASNYNLGYKSTACSLQMSLVTVK